MQDTSLSFGKLHVCLNMFYRRLSELGHTCCLILKTSNTVIESPELFAFGMQMEIDVNKDTS